MKAAGAGAPGTVEATVVVRLSPSPDGGTDLTYDADAAVGGPVGGVGQRMLNGVTKKMAGQFFAAVDAEIAGVRPEERAVAAAPALVAAPTSGTTPVAATPASSVTYAGRAPAAKPGFSLDNASFAAGAVFGGLLALAGVAIGAAIARRR